MVFSGLYIAAVTPFAGDKPDFAALAGNYERWLASDAAGFLCLGSTGEFVSMTHDEKVTLMQATRDLIPDARKMLVGVGCHSVFETAQLARSAAEVGADGLLVITPHYYAANLSTLFFRRYYLAVADRVSLPLLLYNIPQFTGVNLSTELVSVLCRHERIAGTKDSTGNLTRVHDLLAAEEDVNIMVGDVSSLVPAIMMGAHGAILALANAFPQECCQILKAAQAGSGAQALELATPLIRLARQTIGKFGIPGLKALLNCLGYHAGEPRLPFFPVNAKQRSEVERALADYEAAGRPD